MKQDVKIDTYLKWIATTLLIVGCGFTSLNIYPLGPVITGVGGVFWLIVSIMWKEWSLIVTNGTLLSVNAFGLIYTYYII